MFFFIRLGREGAAVEEKTRASKKRSKLTSVRKGARASQQAEPGVPVVRAGFRNVGVRARVAAAGVLVRVREDARVLFDFVFFV